MREAGEKAVERLDRGGKAAGESRLGTEEEALVHRLNDIGGAGGSDGVGRSRPLVWVVVHPIKPGAVNRKQCSILETLQCGTPPMLEPPLAPEAVAVSLLTVI